MRALSILSATAEEDIAAGQSSDCEIQITREFDAPRDLVFKAWTDPRHVAQWWLPEGFTNMSCELDLRVDGMFRLLMRRPDGVIYPCEGVFREISEPERIVYMGMADGRHACGSGLPPHSLVTVTFAEHNGKTTLTINARLASAAHRDAAVKMGFNVGWAASLESLDQLLARIA